MSPVKPGAGISRRFGLLAALAGLFGGMGNAGTGGGYDPHNKRCANPGCGRGTISSEFCCLRCAVLAKRKRAE